MAGRWMDEPDREWRERDWRRSERYGRGEQTPRWGEDRSWSDAADERGYDDDRRYYDDASRRERDRRYGAGGRDYAEPSRLTSGGAAYGAGTYRGESYGRGARETPERFSSQDYTGHRAQPARGGYAGDFDRDDAWARDGDRTYNRDLESRYADDLRRPAAGGSGGYDYERGYGDAGRGREPHGRAPYEDRDHDRGGGADFLQRAGERISSWFRGDNLMRGSRDEDRRDREDFGRETHRGRGPKGYRRSDARITEDVHQRLTDDPFLDASNISVEVKDCEVTLSGTVENREAKHLAERLVEDLPGVTHVQNNLRVDSGMSLTGSGRGFGSSAFEAEMRRHARENDPGYEGASGFSGRTSTGAAAERSTRTDGGSGGVES